jgi:hypothetical protein
MATNIVLNEVLDFTKNNYVKERAVQERAI